MRSNLYELPDLYDALLPVGVHLPFYVELARSSAGGILELAVGTGQLAVPIADAGYETYGLDRSIVMLDSAASRAAKAGVSVELIQGDMRQFDLGRRFGLIFIARNSLLHATSTTDLMATLRSVKRHLAPGGLFAFDIFNPDARILTRPAGERFPVMEVETQAFGRLIVESSHDYDAAAQMDRGTWYISTESERDKWVVPLHMRIIFPQELPLLIELAGLGLVSRFGDVTRVPFGSASPRQVCVSDLPCGNVDGADVQRGNGEF